MYLKTILFMSLSYIEDKCPDNKSLERQSY